MEVVKVYYIVTAEVPTDVKGVWDFMLGKKVYVKDDEHRYFGWDTDFKDAKQFESVEDAIALINKIKDCNVDERGSEWHIVFGLSENDNLVTIERITVESDVIQIIPESELRLPSDKVARAAVDPEYKKYLDLKAKFGE